MLPYETVEHPQRFISDEQATACCLMIATAYKRPGQHNQA